MGRKYCLLVPLICLASLLGAAPRLAGHPLGWHGKAVPTAQPRDLSPEQELEWIRQFHGHVGPYAVLGYRIGRHAVQELQHQKYFGIRVTVHAIPRPPYTCLLDGMQASTGCTLGKRSMVLVPDSPGPDEPLFRIRIQASNGGDLGIEVLPQAKSMFAQWLVRGDSEEQVYERLMQMPREQLWTEDKRFVHLFDRMKLVPDVHALPGHGHAHAGIARVPLCGDQTTTVHFVVPPGAKTAPWAQGGPEYECPTIVTKGQMDLLSPAKDGELRRLTVSAGAVFIWPHGSTELVGFENPHAEPCEFFCVYAPRLPGATTPEAATELLHSSGL
jgi:hypothetical protein